jgi:hypothetical protein
MPAGNTYAPRFLAALLLIPLLAGCHLAQWRGDPAAPSVVLIGDSLVFHADGNSQAGEDNQRISDELIARGLRPYVQGWAGANLAIGRLVWDSPSRNQVAEPDVVVIAFGTNDMKDADGDGPHVPLETSRAILTDWLGVLPADACVRLVGVAETIWGWGLHETGPPFNAMLAQVAATRPGTEYLAWEPDPAWFPEGGADPHPNDEGDAAYRAFLVSAAESCLA